MTREEALTWFKEDMKDGKCSDDCHMCNAMEQAILALEKQIPKKPQIIKFSSGEFYYGQCKCGEHINDDEKYCSNCGQALDWSDIK